MTRRRMVLWGLCLCSVWAGGCVTANQAEPVVQWRRYSSPDPVTSALVLTVHRAPVEQSGHWWIWQAEPTDVTTVPADASIRHIDQGQKLSQPGETVVLLGPYTRGGGSSWSYWALTAGCRPESFRQDHLRSAVQAERDLEILFLPESAGESASDEDVLDAARQTVQVAELLAEQDLLPDWLALLAPMVERVAQRSREDRNREAAQDLLPQLQELQKTAPLSTPFPVNP